MLPNLEDENTVTYPHIECKRAGGISKKFIFEGCVRERGGAFGSRRGDVSLLQIRWELAGVFLLLSLWGTTGFAFFEARFVPSRPLPANAITPKKSPRKHTTLFPEHDTPPRELSTPYKNPSLPKMPLLLNADASRMTPYRNFSGSHEPLLHLPLRSADLSTS